MTGSDFIVDLCSRSCPTGRIGVTKMHIELRPVETKGAVALASRLAGEIWREHYTGLIGSRQVEYMLENFQSPAAIAAQIAAGTAYFLAVADGQPQGYFAIRAELPEMRMMISKLYVRRAMRGKGLGRAILDFVAERARGQGLATLWLTVNKGNPTLRWYERQGFRRAAAIVQPIGNDFVMDDYRMELTLDHGLNCIGEHGTIPSNNEPRP